MEYWTVEPGGILQHSTRPAVAQADGTPATDCNDDGLEAFAWTGDVNADLLAEDDGFDLCQTDMMGDETVPAPTLKEAA